METEDDEKKSSNINLGFDQDGSDDNMEGPEGFPVKDRHSATMEDLLDAAGTTGCRNYIIFFFCTWTTFISPFLLLSYQFLGATPDYWCKTPELEDANWTAEQMKNISLPTMPDVDEPLEFCRKLNLNYSEVASLGYESATLNLDRLYINNDTIKCNTRLFDSKEPETAVTKWDLVCERRVLYSTTQAAPQGGKLFSSVVMGYLMNVFGRKKILSICIPLYLVIGLVTTLSPNIETYIALKFLISLVQMAFPMGGMILGMELCSTGQRSFYGSMFFIPISIGFMILPGIAYFIRSFTYLHLALTMPILTLLPILWIVPESPRWLVLKGRYQESISILKSIAKSNKKVMPSDRDMLDSMQKIRSEVEQGKEGKRVVFGYFHRVSRLLLDPSWCWKVFIIFFGWFSGSMTYYGVSLNSYNISQNKYIYTFLGGLMEIPSYFLLWPTTKYFGRRKTLIGFYLGCASSIIGAAILSYISGDTEEKFSGWLLFLSLLGKLCVNAAYNLMWFYTTEIIPTEQRSEFIGLSSMFARIGSVCSPYIVDLLGEVAHWIPSAIFGGICLVAGTLFIFLPETKGIQLAESK